MDVTWIDWLLIGIIVLSTLISLIRGFTREVFSLITWLVAVVVAVRFTPQVAAWLAQHIGSDELRVIAAFAGLFIATVVIGSLINFGIAQLVSSSGLSGTDRLLGSLFGIARGVLVCLLLIIAAGLTPLVNKPEWQETRLIPAFAPLTQWALTFVPQEATVAWLKQLAPAAAEVKKPEKKPPEDLGVVTNSTGK